MLPDFFVVGAPKCGTTSLCNYLAAHPEIFFSQPKELNYFSGPDIVAQGLYYRSYRIETKEQYEKVFAGAGGYAAVGEGSVSYLFYPEVPGRIKQLVPDARIIILLRDPVQRAYSHYWMDWRLGLIDIPFGEVVSQTSGHRLQELYYQQYVELSLYSAQVSRYLDTFKVENVRIYLDMDMKDGNMGEVVGDVCHFLGVTDAVIPNHFDRHNRYMLPRNRFIRWLYAFRSVRSALSRMVPEAMKKGLRNAAFTHQDKPAIEPDVHRKLCGIFRPDIDRLQKRIGRDLSGWCRYE